MYCVWYACHLRVQACKNKHTLEHPSASPAFLHAYSTYWRMYIHIHSIHIHPCCSIPCSIITWHRHCFHYINLCQTEYRMNTFAYKQLPINPHMSRGCCLHWDIACTPATYHKLDYARCIRDLQYRQDWPTKTHNIGSGHIALGYSACSFKAVVLPHNYNEDATLRISQFNISWTCLCTNDLLKCNPTLAAFSHTFFHNTSTSIPCTALMSLHVRMNGLRMLSSNVSHTISHITYYIRYTKIY